MEQYAFNSLKENKDKVISDFKNFVDIYFYDVSKEIITFNEFDKA